MLRGDTLLPQLALGEPPQRLAVEGDVHTENRGRRAKRPVYDNLVC